MTLVFVFDSRGLTGLHGDCLLNSLSRLNTGHLIDRDRVRIGLEIQLWSVQVVPGDLMRSASLKTCSMERFRVARFSRPSMATKASKEQAQRRRHNPTCWRFNPTCWAILSLKDLANPNRMMLAPWTNCCDAVRALEICSRMANCHDVSLASTRSTCLPKDCQVV